ncbi:RNA polymerase sigma factor, partial [Rothia sp. 27098_8_161]
MARNPQSEVTLEPQPHQYPTAQLSALSESTQDEDRYLVLRAQDGDIDAFEKLVKRYQGRLFRSAYMIVRNRQDSEDIVQDTLVQAWG